MNKLELVLRIQEAATIYKENLMGKKFLFVYEGGKYIEVIFSASSFKHLVGVESKLSALQLFEDASNKRLKVSNIWFSNRHPFRVSVVKVKNMLSLPSLVFEDSFLLEEIETKSKHYKIGSTNIDFTLCFNYPVDGKGNIKSECLNAESLRDEDCFNKSENVYEITHILSKPNDSKVYDTLCFMDKRYTVDDIPKSINFDIK